MSDEIECPYCLNEQTWDDYYETEEEAIDELQCNTCNKYFAATWSSGNVILESEKAPCMNGEDHKFVSSSHDNCFRCEYCCYEERGELNEVTKEMLKRD